MNVWLSVTRTDRLTECYHHRARHSYALPTREKQAAKVVWCKAASRFSRIRQVAPMWPHLVHSNRHPHLTGAAPCWVAFSISTAGHVWAGPFSPSKLTLHVWGSGLPSNTWFLWLTRVHIPNGTSIGSAVFACLTVVTDRPRYTPSVAIGCI